MKFLVSFLFLAKWQRFLVFICEPFQSLAKSTFIQSYIQLVNFLYTTCGNPNMLEDRSFLQKHHEVVFLISKTNIGYLAYQAFSRWAYWTDTILFFILFIYLIINIQISNPFISFWQPDHKCIPLLCAALIHHFFFS